MMDENRRKATDSNHIKAEYGDKDVPIPKLHRDSGLAGILLLARYYGIPADEEKLKHEFNLFDRETDVSILLRIAKSMKLKAKCIALASEQLSDISLPGMVRSYDPEI